MTDKLRARPSDQALAVPVEPASRLDPSGFDPSRVVLEHYSAEPVFAVESRKQGNGGGGKDWHWRGKPNGFWVSVKGENDWPDWCNAESYGSGQLGICHRIHLQADAAILHVSGAAELVAFDARYGRNERLFSSSTYEKRLIDWAAVARAYDGIIIAPYVWEHRLEEPISDWYYGWDCASGVIWNGAAIAAIAMEARSGETAGLDPKDDSAGRNGIAQGIDP